MAKQPTNLQKPLTAAEFNELDQFLMSDFVSDDTMTIDILDGFLTATIIGPVTLRMSEILNEIWGEEGSPEFETTAQAERIIGLIFRHMNDIIHQLQADTGELELVFNYRDFEGHEYTDAESWAYDFMQGVKLKQSDWQPLLDDAHGAEMLRPIHLLGSDEALTDEAHLLTETPAQRGELSEQIPDSVIGIYHYWLPYRQAVAERTIATTFERAHPKTGRNDPCPCGSGKKFKKCCGAAADLH
jgi:uncharacterized protein